MGKLENSKFRGGSIFELSSVSYSYLSVLWAYSNIHKIKGKVHGYQKNDVSFFRYVLMVLP